MSEKRNTQSPSTWALKVRTTDSGLRTEDSGLRVQFGRMAFGLPEFGIVDAASPLGRDNKAPNR